MNNRIRLHENESVPPDEPLGMHEYNVFPYLTKGDTFLTELAFFEANKEDLINEHGEGKFVLIKNEEVVGVYEDIATGAEAGYKRFGYIPLFIQEIRREPRIYYA
jgi:hypothetical protein